MTNPSPTTGDSALRLAEDRPDSYEAIWNALWAIDTAAIHLPTFEVRHNGGIEEFTQNVVDAITEAAATLRSLAAQRDELADCLRVAIDSGLGEAWLWPESARKTFMANARALLSKVEQA